MSDESISENGHSLSVKQNGIYDRKQQDYLARHYAEEATVTGASAFEMASQHFHASIN